MYVKKKLKWDKIVRKVVFKFPGWVYNEFGNICRVPCGRIRAGKEGYRI